MTYAANSPRGPLRNSALSWPCPASQRKVIRALNLLNEVEGGYATEALRQFAARRGGDRKRVFKSERHVDTLETLAGSGTMSSILDLDALLTRSPASPSVSSTTARWHLLLDEDTQHLEINWQFATAKCGVENFHWVRVSGWAANTRSPCSSRRLADPVIQPRRRRAVRARDRCSSRTAVSASSISSPELDAFSKAPGTLDAPGESGGGRYRQRETLRRRSAAERGADRKRTRFCPAGSARVVADRA